MIILLNIDTPMSASTQKTGIMTAILTQNTAIQGDWKCRFVKCGRDLKGNVSSF